MSQDSNQTPSAQIIDQTMQPATSTTAPSTKTANKNPLAALEELIQRTQQKPNEQGEPAVESADESGLVSGPVEVKKTPEEIEQLRQVKELETQQQIKQQQAAIQENIATAPGIQRRAEVKQAEAKTKEVAEVVNNMEIHQLSHTKINK